MISNRCARKSLVTNCNSIISKNYLQLLVDSNDTIFKVIRNILFTAYKTKRLTFFPQSSIFLIK